MNLNIRNIDPETRGLLYRLQAEQGLPNLAETLKFVLKGHYVKPVWLRDMKTIEVYECHLCPYRINDPGNGKSYCEEDGEHSIVIPQSKDKFPAFCPLDVKEGKPLPEGARKEE